LVEDRQAAGQQAGQRAHQQAQSAGQKDAFPAPAACFTLVGNVAGAWEGVFFFQLDHHAAQPAAAQDNQSLQRRDEQDDLQDRLLDQPGQVVEQDDHDQQQADTDFGKAVHVPVAFGSFDGLVDFFVLVVHVCLFLYAVCKANRFVLYDMRGFCQVFWRQNGEYDTNLSAEHS